MIYSIIGVPYYKGDHNILSKPIVVKALPDTQHNETLYNDTQHNDTQHNDTQHNDTQHNDIQHSTK